MGNSGFGMLVSQTLRKIKGVNRIRHRSPLTSCVTAPEFHPDSCSQARNDDKVPIAGLTNTPVLDKRLHQMHKFTSSRISPKHKKKNNL